jgi:hypothetical protein
MKLYFKFHMVKSLKNEKKNHICINNKNKKYIAWFNIFKY